MKVLLKHELKYYFKNRVELTQFIGLFISIILLIPFGQAMGSFHYQALAAGIVWIALTMAVSVAGSNLYQRDYDSGKLEAYQMVHPSLEVLAFTKWLAYSIAVLLPAWLVLPLTLLMLNIPAGQWPHYYLGLSSGALDLTLITAMAAVLMTGLQRIGAILALIVLPLTIPVIIFGAHYLMGEDALFQPSLVFLWGFAALMLPVYCLVGASCIRASN